jgi:ElaB/YqjD/DUF883 family membrane-anchored ribosome-binding protein
MDGSVLEEFFIQIGINVDDVRSGEKAITLAVLSIQDQLKKLVDSFEQAAEGSGSAQKDVAESANGMADNIEKSSKKATTSFGKLKKELISGAKETQNVFGSLKNELLAFVGLSLSIGGAVKFVTGMTHSSQSIGILSKAFNTDPRQIDGFRKAYTASGASDGEADANLRSMQDTISGFANGNTNTPLGNLARMLGVDIDYEHGSAGTELKKILTALGQVRDPNRRRALAQEGGISDAVLQGVMPGGNLLKNQAYFAQHSSVNQAQIDGANKLQFALTQLDSKFETVRTTIFLALLPVANDLIDILNDWGKWLQDHPKEVKEFIDNLKKGISDLKSWVDKATDAVGGWSNAIKILVGVSVGGKLLGLITGLTSNVIKLGSAFVGLTGLTTAFLTNPIVMAALGLVMPLNNSPNQTEEMDERERLARSNFDKAHPGMPFPGIQDFSQVKLGPQGQGAFEQYGQSARTFSKGAGRALLDFMSGTFGQLEAQYNLPTGLLRSMAMTESSGNPLAQSSAGAKGLFQFMARTARDMGLNGNDVFDPQKSAQAAARYIAQLLQHYHSNIQKALAAYNRGVGNVDKYGLSGLPAETLAYVPKVISGLPQSGASLAAGRYASHVNYNTNSSRGGDTNIDKVIVTTNPRDADSLANSVKQSARGGVVFAYDTGQ